MSEEIKWEEPPVPKRSRFDEFWAALKDSPGRWARYPGTGTIGQGRYPGYQVRNGRDDAGITRQWVRFIGDGESK